MERMTNEQIEAIRKRVEKATEGPWHPVFGFDGEASVVSHTDNFGEVASEMYDHDADFIAHAREDVPALLAEIDRLKAKVDKLSGVIYDSGCEINLGDDDDE